MKKKYFTKRRKKIDDLFETCIHENNFSQKDVGMKVFKKELTDDSVKENFYEK
jgi:hypothetical protein